MDLLKDKNLVITGVLTEASIAFAVARLAQEEGANVVLTSMPRTVRLTERISRRLPVEAPVLPLDVSDANDLSALEGLVRGHFGGDEARVDGVLHAIGFAPQTALGGGFLTAPWEDVATALHISTYSLVSLTTALKPLLDKGSSVVGLDFDATVAWPAYDWMGVAKAGLESAARYLARELGPDGIRVNLVAAGPLRTTAAKSIDGFDGLTGIWAEKAPLGWDVRDPEPTARACVALLSPWFPATTGEVVHVDGGVHAVGA